MQITVDNYIRLGEKAKKISISMKLIQAERGWGYSSPCAEKKKTGIIY